MPRCAAGVGRKGGRGPRLFPEGVSHLLGERESRVSKVACDSSETGDKAAGLALWVLLVLDNWGDSGEPEEVTLICINSGWPNNAIPTSYIKHRLLSSPWYGLYSIP